MATTETAEAAAAATTAAAATEPEIKFSPKAFRYFTPAKYASMLDRRGRRRSPRSCAANFTPNGGKFLATNFCVRLRRSSTSQDTRRARCEWECLRACVCEESAKGQAPSPIGVPMCVCVCGSLRIYCPGKHIFGNALLFALPPPALQHVAKLSKRGRLSCRCSGNRLS